MNSRCSKRLDSRLAAVGTKSKRFYVPISLLIKRARPCARVARVRPPVRARSARPSERAAAAGAGCAVNVLKDLSVAWFKFFKDQQQ